MLLEEWTEKCAYQIVPCYLEKPLLLQNDGGWMTIEMLFQNLFQPHCDSNWVVVWQGVD